MKFIKDNDSKTVKDLVSVIVPIYDILQEYLECCLNSLVCQTYQKIEIILIDDGSHDQSGEICDFYAEKYLIVKVIHQENQGVSVARNIGILVAVGEYLMFVDPDDWLEKDCIETALSEINHQNVDLLFFQYVIEKDGKTEGTDRACLGSVGHDDLNQIQMDMIAGTTKYGLGPRSPWGKIIRKSIVIENNVKFPAGLKKSQDVVFNLYLEECVGKAYESDYLGYHYRCHRDSISWRYNPEMPQIMCQLLNEFAQFVQKYHDDDYRYKVCIGIRTILAMRIIEQTYTFYQGSRLSKTEILKITKGYINDEIVSKYLDYCRVKDIPGLKKRVSFLLLKGNHYKFYYAYKRFGQMLNKLKMFL